MILSIDVCVKSLFALGSRFRWPRVELCPLCGGRLWGHGSSLTCFDGSPHPIALPRYRCSACHKTFKIRPAGYWSRFQASIADIRESLSHRLTHFRWPPGRSASRQRHWLKGLQKQIRARLGVNWAGDLLEGFDQLCREGLRAVSRSIQSAHP